MNLQYCTLHVCIMEITIALVIGSPRGSWVFRHYCEVLDEIPHSEVPLDGAGCKFLEELFVSARPFKGVHYASNEVRLYSSAVLVLKM